MKLRRVVVTGLGTITALGSGVDAFWKNLLSGTSGVSAIEKVDVSDIPTKIAAEIKDFDIEQYMSRREARRRAVCRRPSGDRKGAQGRAPTAS